MEKKVESAKRTRYIRELNIFMNKIASVVQREGLDMELLLTALQKAQERLERVEKVAIYSSHINTIEDSIERVINFERESFEELRAKIQKECNNYERERRSKNYKKPKHKKRDEGWE